MGWVVMINFSDSVCFWLEVTYLARPTTASGLACQLIDLRFFCTLDVVKYGHQLEMPASHNYADEPEVCTKESEISMVSG